jgi:actin-like ATPase involved in cell morphogenesis
MAVSEMMAEVIKMKIGSAVPLKKTLEIKLRGKDLASGMPKIISITDSDIRTAIKEPTQAIIEAVRRVLVDDLVEIGLGGGFCPIHQNGIHPSRVAGGDGLIEQIKEAPQLFFEIGAHFHAACHFLPNARDPCGADPGKHFLNGG